MIPKQVTITLPAAALLGLMAYVAPGAIRDTGTPAAGAIVLVNLDAVVDAYSGREARWAEVERVKQQADQRTAAIQDEIKSLGLARDGFAEGSFERAEAELAVRAREAVIEETVRLFEQKANRTLQRVNMELYVEVRRGIADFAKAKGYQLVLRQWPDDPRGAAQYEYSRVRSVLYSDDASDVTEQVILFLKSWNPAEKND